MGLTRVKANQILNTGYKQAVRAVADSNISVNGSAPNTVDGVTLSSGNRILVTAQTNPIDNGLYQVQTVGNAGNGTWVRTTDADETGEIEAGMLVMVTEGTVYADSLWKLTTNNPIIIGTTALNFSQVDSSSAAGGNTQIQFNDNGSLDASAALTFNKTSNLVSVTGNVSVSGDITAGNLTNTIVDGGFF